MSAHVVGVGGSVGNPDGPVTISSDRGRPPCLLLEVSAGVGDATRPDGDREQDATVDRGRRRRARAPGRHEKREEDKEDEGLACSQAPDVPRRRRNPRDARQAPRRSQHRQYQIDGQNKSRPDQLDRAIRPLPFRRRAAARLRLPRVQRPQDRRTPPGPTSCGPGRELLAIPAERGLRSEQRRR